VRAEHNTKLTKSVQSLQTFFICVMFPYERLLFKRLLQPCLKLCI